MSSRWLLIVGIVGGVVAGVAVFTLALAVVAIDGAALSGQAMATIVLAAMLAFVLDAAWLSLALDRLSKLGRRGDDDEGGEGWGRPERDPVRPRPPSEDPDWWPAFERDFREYDNARNRTPTAD
jgi:hypothetical protein